MKLASAEERARFLSTCPFNEQIIVVRQIQANAIRWAGWISRSAADARDFERIANQLDPLPEPKDQP